MVSERCALLEGSVSEPFPSGSLGQGQGTWGREGHRGRGPEGNVAVSQGQGWGACWGVKAAGSESSWGVGAPSMTSRFLLSVMGPSESCEQRATRNWLLF